MKDQYIADIGDYGKYSLLKAFCDSGVRVGINWYYTKNDDSNDGRHTLYLDRPKKWRSYEPEVFDALLRVFHSNRCIQEIEKQHILSNAVYYRKPMDFWGNSYERREQRYQWMDESTEALSSSELVFLDPDNGLLNSKSKIKRNLEKYILPEEILSLYQGHNVVYYCQKGRRKEEDWERYKAAMLYDIPGAKPAVLTFHGGTQRSYVFLIHPRDYQHYMNIILPFKDKWNGIFTLESAKVQNKDEIRDFAAKWKDRFMREKYVSIYDEMEFPNDARNIGFNMDCNHSWEEVFPQVEERNAIKVLREKKDDLSPQLLGSRIFSEWRYWNHWAMSRPDDSVREWFVDMLDLLEEVAICKNN